MYRCLQMVRLQKCRIKTCFATFPPSNSISPHLQPAILKFVFCRSYRKAKAAGDSGPVKQVLELYNLERDPGERHNLASRRPELVIRLRNMALNYYRCQHTIQISEAEGCISENWFRHDSWDCRPQNMYGQVSLLVAGTNFPKISLLICNLLKVLDSASAFGGVSGWGRAVVDTRCQPDGASHREALRCVITCHHVSDNPHK